MYVKDLKEGRHYVIKWCGKLVEAAYEGKARDCGKTFHYFTTDALRIGFDSRDVNRDVIGRVWGKLE